MKVMGRRSTGSLVAVFLLSLCVLSLSPQGQQVMSEKELFKRGEILLSEGKLLEAREALIAAFDKRAARNNKQPDKKFTPMLDEINKRLADNAAEQGRAAFGLGDLETCEQKLEEAQRFSRTAGVIALESDFQKRIADIRKSFESAKSAAENGRFEDSLARLRELTVWSRYLPDVNSTITAIEETFAKSLVAQGNNLVESQRWADANSAFEQALTVRPDNAAAREGLQRVSLGIAADNLAVSASERLRQGQHAEAYSLIREAIAMYPGIPKFQEIQSDVRNSWMALLRDRIPALMADPNNFLKSKQAYLSLLAFRELDPSSDAPTREWAEAPRNFAENCIERALTLEQIPDYSRIATAYALRLNAGLQITETLFLPEEIKRVADAFNRKRASQLVISVENLSGATPTFTELVQARVFNTVEKQALPDLRIRQRQQYYSAPDEDPQFQDLRPDGKSATALLTVGISAYQSERWSSETPVSLPSQFISGSEKITNPEYLELQNHLEVMLRSIQRAEEKKKSITDEGWTRPEYVLKAQELSKIDRYIEQPRLSDYTYSRIDHHQKTVIKVQLTIRDFLTRETIASDEISFVDEREGAELTGVHERDANGLRNEPVRLPPTDQVLREAERTVLDSLEARVSEILPAYTKRFFNQGKKALALGQPAEAAEQFLCHWAFFRGRLDGDEADVTCKTVREETAFDLHRESAEFRKLVDRVAPVVP
jgi:tetratricopeptide (TPR) repeat protein